MLSRSVQTQDTTCVFGEAGSALLRRDVRAGIRLASVGDGATSGCAAGGGDDAAVGNGQREQRESWLKHTSSAKHFVQVFTSRSIFPRLYCRCSFSRPISGTAWDF
jgi:hypothetical protein